jgi:uncharacterized membrane protein YGL010W
MKSLVDQMSVYAAYHNDATNKAIHFVFVPLIVWSGMGLLMLPGAWRLGTIAITAALVVATAMLVYYLLLDLPLGVGMVVLFTLLYVTAWQARTALGGQAWILFAAVFAGSWVAQVLGHSAFEHRKPALVDNVFQVFVAPIFVLAEWAFTLGLRRQLHDAVQRGMVQHLPKTEKAA